MATQSIMKNIAITEPGVAEIFISAMEKAAEAAEASIAHEIDSEDLSRDELNYFLILYSHNE